MTDDPKDQQDQPSQWAVVELFGHARIAGKITQQTFAGASLVRVDVPEVEVEDTCYAWNAAESRRESVSTKRTIPAFTRSFGAAAIYSVNWCDEATARRAAKSIEHEPLKPYAPELVPASVPQQRLIEGSATASSTGHRSVVDAFADDDDDGFPG